MTEPGLLQARLCFAWPGLGLASMNRVRNTPTLIFCSHFLNKIVFQLHFSENIKYIWDMYVHVAFGLAQGMLMPMNLKVDALSWPGFFYTLLCGSRMPMNRSSNNYYHNWRNTNPFLWPTCHLQCLNSVSLIECYNICRSTCDSISASLRQNSVLPICLKLLDCVPSSYEHKKNSTCRG